MTSQINCLINGSVEWLKKGKMKNFYVPLLIFVIFGRKCSTREISLICTEQFCDDYVQRFPCPPLDPICSDPEKSLVIPSLTVCNCCEHCFIFQDVGESCVNGRPGEPLPTVMCKPGTECVEEICKEKSGPDPDFYPGYECSGGKCQCAVLENNTPKKIFGTFDYKDDLKNEKQCECSITAYLAQQSINKVLPVPDLYIPIPRCLPNGQFDPLQCINNMCGCVNKTTGSWDMAIRKVPIPALGPNNPKCFDIGRHKIGEYYTRCERERNDLMFETISEDYDEADIIHSHKVVCRPDGQYATVNP